MEEELRKTDQLTNCRAAHLTCPVCRLYTCVNLQQFSYKPMLITALSYFLHVVIAHAQRNECSTTLSRSSPIIRFKMWGVLLVSYYQVMGLYPFY